jgi:hypothetical protein
MDKGHRMRKKGKGEGFHIGKINVSATQKM